MHSSDKYILLLSTCPDDESARTLASKLLESSLVACVNIVPGLESWFRWQGKINRENECLLIIKTENRCCDELEALIQSEHPYELPEIISVSIDAGSRSYLNWISENIRPDDIKSV